MVNSRSVQTLQIGFVWSAAVGSRRVAYYHSNAAFTILEQTETSANARGRPDGDGDLDVVLANVIGHYTIASS
jgi:hypothetical protein